jgi:hypothetical protein
VSRRSPPAARTHRRREPGAEVRGGGGEPCWRGTWRRTLHDHGASPGYGVRDLVLPGNQASCADLQTLFGTRGAASWCLWGGCDRRARPPRRSVVRDQNCECGSRGCEPPTLWATCVAYSSRNAARRDSCPICEELVRRANNGPARSRAGIVVMAVRSFVRSASVAPARLRRRLRPAGSPRTFIDCCRRQACVLESEGLKRRRLSATRTGPIAAPLFERNFLRGPRNPKRPSSGELSTAHFQRLRRLRRALEKHATR